MVYAVAMAEMMARLMLRLPADLHAALVAAAKEDERSLNAQIIYMLRQALKIRTRQ